MGGNSNRENQICLHREGRKARGTEISSPKQPREKIEIWHGKAGLHQKKGKEDKTELRRGRKKTPTRKEFPGKEARLPQQMYRVEGAHRPRKKAMGQFRRQGKGEKDVDQKGWGKGEKGHLKARSSDPEEEHPVRPEKKLTPFLMGEGRWSTIKRRGLSNDEYFLQEGTSPSRGKKKEHRRRKKWEKKGKGFRHNGKRS